MNRGLFRHVYYSLRPCARSRSVVLTSWACRYLACGLSSELEVVESVGPVEALKVDSNTVRPYYIKTNGQSFA